LKRLFETEFCAIKLDVLFVGTGSLYSHYNGEGRIKEFCNNKFIKRLMEKEWYQLGFVKD
jgi:hypothetical protein